MTALTGDLITIDGRDALRFQRRLPHAPERVWRAVSDPDELGQWFVATVPWTPAAGESFDVMGEPLRVTAVDPPRTLAWEWGEERYRFDLEADGDGATLLTFTHVFVTTYGPGVQHAAGWETYFDRLDGLLAGTPLSEAAAHDPVAEYHEAYAARFAADPGSGRRMIASMGFRDLTLVDARVLRLERRYRHPIARIWRAITDPEELAHWFPELQERVVVNAVEPTLLELTWWGQEVRFELRADGEETLMVFTHAFDPATSARTAAGWDRCFFALDALLAGVPVDRATSLEHWPLVHERYADRFGTDPEIGRAALG